MSDRHVHVEVRCPHGARLGGCKCLIANGEVVQVEHRATCPLAEDCPERADHEFRAERLGNWPVIDAEGP